MVLWGQPHALAALPPGKSPWNPVTRKMDGCQCLFGHFGEVGLSTPGSDWKPTLSGPESIQHIDYANSAPEFNVKQCSGLIWTELNTPNNLQWRQATCNFRESTNVAGYLKSYTGINIKHFTQQKILQSTTSDTSLLSNVRSHRW
jgi:hypothetical protein